MLITCIQYYSCCRRFLEAKDGFKFPLFYEAEASDKRVSANKIRAEDKQSCSNTSESILQKYYGKIYGHVTSFPVMTLYVLQDRE
jgi:hypothetical protein